MDLRLFIFHNENWREILKSEGIKIQEEGNLVMFSYNKKSKISCKFDKEYHRECRGNILDLTTMQFICTSFKKFFNYGESKADKIIEGSKIVVSEKLDGSIVKYFYNPYTNKFQWATNGKMDASMTTSSAMIFQDIINSAITEMNSQEVEWNNLDKNYTYIFELTSPHNMIVIPHNESKLSLLGIINNKTQEERIPYTNQFLSVAKKLHVPIPKRYEFQTMEELIENTKLLSEMNEGYVVADYSNTFDVKRIKCKGPAYVELHHVGTNIGLNDRNLFEVIKSGEIDEFTSYFPALSDRINKINTEFDTICDILLSELKKLNKELEKQKPQTRREISLIINSLIFPGIMFGFHDKKYTLQEYVESIDGIAFVKLREKFLGVSVSE